MVNGQTGAALKQSMSQGNSLEKGWRRCISTYQHPRVQGWWRREGTDSEKRGTEGENAVGDNLQQALSSSTAALLQFVAFAGCWPCLLCDALPPELRTQPSGMCYPLGPVCPERLLQGKQAHVLSPGVRKV